MDAGCAKWLDDPLGADAPGSGFVRPAASTLVDEPSRDPCSGTRAAAPRSLVETMPSAGAPLPREALDEELPTPSERDRRALSWCVDFGAAIRTLSTFEMWTAIERGEVTADLRVWREGMECWQPIAQVSSLSVAFSVLEPLVTPAPPEAGATTNPTPDVVERDAETPAPAPLSTPRLAAPRRPIRGGWAAILDPGTRWMALGSGVAAGAITAALMAGHRPPPRPALPVGPTETAVAAAPAPPAVEWTLPVLPALPAQAPEAAPVAAGGSPAGELRAHHAERGQKRLRQGKRLAQGR